MSTSRFLSFARAVSIFSRNSGSLVTRKMTSAANDVNAEQKQNNFLLQTYLRLKPLSVRANASIKGALIPRPDSAHMLSDNFRRAEPEKELQPAEYYRNVIQLSESRKKIRH
jgi:hypothetical protein